MYGSVILSLLWFLARAPLGMIQLGIRGPGSPRVYSLQLTVLLGHSQDKGEKKDHQKIHVILLSESKVARLLVLRVVNVEEGSFQAQQFLSPCHAAAAAAAKSLQSCPTVQPQRRQPTRLPRPWDSPGKNTGVGCHCLLQCVKVKSLSCVQLLGTPWTAAHQTPPSMGFSRQEYWSGVPLPFYKMFMKARQYQSCEFIYITIKIHKDWK